MPNIETAAAETANTGGVKANWAALEDFSDVPVKTEEKTPEPEKQEVEQQEIKTETQPEVKEETPENKVEETEPKPEEVKAEEKQEEPSPLEIKLEDIKDIPQEYADGTFQALAKDLYGIDLPEESVDAFKDFFVPKSELEKVQSITIDSLLSTLKPETAAAIKLIEAGIPEDRIFAPTREIDYHLSLDDAALIRADLEAQGDLTPEIIDNEMEKVASDPAKMKIEADRLRIMLNREKNQVLQERQFYLNKYQQDKQAATLQQREQEKTQVINELNKVSTFMGVPISKEVKEAFIRKYNSGLYDNDLNNPASKAEFIYHKELNDKLTKHIQNKAFEAAKKEEREKLLNVPPKVSGGKKIDTSKQQPTNNHWGALEDFK